MKLHKIRYRFKNYLTAELAVRRDYLIIFLGVLCDLRGEILCFFFDQTGRFSGQQRRSYSVLVPVVFNMFQGSIQVFKGKYFQGYNSGKSF